MLSLLRQPSLKSLAQAEKWRARWYYYFASEHRKKSKEWIAQFVSPEQEPARFRKMVWRHLVIRSQIDNLAKGHRLYERLLRTEPDQVKKYWSVTGWELVDQALQKGRGCILLLSHVGHPNILQWYLKHCSTPWANLLLISRKVNQLNCDTSGNRKNLREQHSPQYTDAYFPLPKLRSGIQSLRRNEIVLIAGDRCDSDNPLKMPVLGVQQTIATGGVALGIMNETPVLPYFVNFDPMPHWSIQIEPPLNPGTYDDRNLRRENMLNDYISRIERFINQYPDNVQRKRYMRSTSSGNLE